MFGGGRCASKSLYTGSYPQLHSHRATLGGTHNLSYRSIKKLVADFDLKCDSGKVLSVCCFGAGLCQEGLFLEQLNFKIWLYDYPSTINAVHDILKENASYAKMNK